MHPVPYTREAEELALKLMEGKLDGMHDTHGVIRFHKVFEWLRSTFGKGRFYKFAAVQMRNYIVFYCKRY
jgi:hypothetical protein